MKMVQNRIWGAVVPVLLLSACATSSNPKPEPAGDAAAVLSKFSGKDASPGAKNTPQMGHTRSQILMKSGVEFLAAGELDKAKQVFNTALKFDIKNAPLHFLNALTYHTTYLRGDVEGFAMAEAGYRAAITHDASMDLAYLQLGRLYLDARDFTRAKQSMALAVESDNRSIPAYYGLAQAAFLEGDLPTSYWAVNELERLKWTSPALYRLKAMQAAVTRQPDRAHAFAAEYAKSTDDAADAGYLTGRVNRLLTIRTALVQEGAPPAGRESAGQLVAQAGAEPVAATKNPKPGTAAKPVAAKA
jgi:Tfp pilus assembly protein PilF